MRVGKQHRSGPKSHVSKAFLVGKIVAVAMEIWNHECGPFWPNFRHHRRSQQCKITVLRKSLNRWRWRQAGPVCPLVCGKLANRSQRFPCANSENAQVRNTCKPSTLLPSATYIQFCTSSVDSISR